MPRSRRRRQRDRRREADQRLAAKLVFQEARSAEKIKLDRYVRSIFRTRAGEVVQSKDGQKYQVQNDGSLRRVQQLGDVVGQEG